MIAAFPVRGVSLALLSVALCGAALYAQTENGAETGKTISIRMIDSKNGQVISTTELLVQINHQQEVHADWAHLDPDGVPQVTLPPGTKEILIHGKYGNSMQLYVNCDTPRNRLIPANEAVPDRWYKISDIVTFGVVGSNTCTKPKVPFKVDAKPGDFAFFVRKQNWREEDLQ